MEVTVQSNNSESDPILPYLQLAARESEQATNTPDGIVREFDRQIQRATISHKTAAAPALPLEILLPRLDKSCTPRILCNSLRKDAIFQQNRIPIPAEFPVRDIAESQHNIPLSINAWRGHSNRMSTKLCELGIRT
jgi:hypothetical protein